MKKLGLLLVACFAFATISVAQNNIVKSLERNVPGQGKVTIHQDARIAALIGSEYVPAGSRSTTTTWLNCVLSDKSLT